ncbi:hypothetical protein D3C71_1778770 [compost metagenome]
MVGLFADQWPKDPARVAFKVAHVQPLALARGHLQRVALGEYPQRLVLGAGPGAQIHFSLLDTHHLAGLCARGGGHTKDQGHQKTGKGVQARHGAPD